MLTPDSISEIRLLVTGGTIDKSYCPVAGALSFSRPHLRAVLQPARAEIARCG
jgi:hypothetical protein